MAVNISRRPTTTVYNKETFLHLAANEVNLEEEPITLGPVLTMDPAKERYIGKNSGMANMFLKRNYREPFIVPENV